MNIFYTFRGYCDNKSRIQGPKWLFTRTNNRGKLQTQIWTIIFFQRRKACGFHLPNSNLNSNIFSMANMYFFFMKAILKS